MKISDKSLHYRFNKLVQGHAFEYRAVKGRFTTCSYVRTTIFSAISGLCKSFVIALLAGLVLSVVYSTFAVPVMLFALNLQPNGFMMGASTMGNVVIVLALMGLLNEMLKQRALGRQQSKPREPNVFIQAIKDKHAKFCTRVEVE